MPCLGAVAAAGLWLTELAPMAQACLALAALLEGGRLGWVHAHAARRGLCFDSHDAPRLLIDGQPVAGYRIQWRGPCLFLTWRMPAGRTQCLVFWPGQLSGGERRMLRLMHQNSSAANGRASRRLQSVAP